ncbi:MAG: hypothetical protein IPP07_13125 [Holophagales bacterium]|nr:hypothetical protein [Holophagales bacterium]
MNELGTDRATFYQFDSADVRAVVSQRQWARPGIDSTSAIVVRDLP